MRRGCISLGDVECDGCHHNVLYLERYLIVEEEEDAQLRLCHDCAMNRDYVRYRQEKGERLVTFFPRPISITED